MAVKKILRQALTVSLCSTEHKTVLLFRSGGQNMLLFSDFNNLLISFTNFCCETSELIHLLDAHKLACVVRMWLLTKVLMVTLFSTRLRQRH